MIKSQTVLQLFLFQFIFLMSIKAQTENRVKSAVIEGRIFGKNIQDTAILFLKKDFIYGYIGQENYAIKCDSNGNFKINFHISHPATITLQLGENNLLFHDFFIEPGDSIFIRVTKDANAENSVSFSGKGSENFKCMYALDSCRRNLFFESPRLKILNNVGDSLINEVFRQISSSAMYSDPLYSILSTYKDKIAPQIYELLYADITGDFYNAKCSHLSYSLIDASPEQEKSISRIFFQEVYNLPDKINDSIAAYSDKYIEYLFRRTQLKLKLQDKKNYSMEGIVNLLINDYNGVIRDRLLVRYLITSNNMGASSKVYEYCLRKSLEVMQTPIYKQYLEERLRKLSKGSPAYNFSLSDMNGKMVSLSDFKGKAVLLDFWFTGCSACVELSKEMDKSVIPKFKDSSVVFVSICLDKEREKWIKSVGTGKYTNEESINLFTDGLAFDHPLVKYYNIQGCPTLLLIDKEGRISSSNPHRDPVQLIEDIKSAIKSE